MCWVIKNPNKLWNSVAQKSCCRSELQEIEYNNIFEICKVVENYNYDEKIAKKESVVDRQIKYDLIKCEK